MMEMPSIAVIAVLASSVYVFWQYVLYPVFFSPLSSIPAAHPLARITSWWITYIRWTKHELRTIHAAHQKYPIVLLGPDEISVNCIKGGIQTVYSGGFEKGDWYDIFANYDVRNMFSTPWSKAHSTRKRMISNIYSKSFLQSSPTLAKITKTILYDRLLPRFDELAKGEPFNIYAEMSGATMDFVTNYQFGMASGSNFIQDLTLRGNYLEWYQSRVGFSFWPQECPRLTAFFSKLGIQLVPEHVGTANDCIQAWNLSMCDGAVRYLKGGPTRVEDVVESEVGNFPMVYGQLATAMGKSKGVGISVLDEERTRYEIASEMLDHLGAGFDTSGITLCYVLHELSLRLDVQTALRKELRSLDPPVSLNQIHSGGHIPSSKELDALPFLEAILQETLRLRAAIPGPEPRITPVGGCRLGPEGEYGRIPGGIRISAQAHSLHRNPEVFETPEEWIPERWLAADEEKRKEMQRWFWAFGSGGRMCVGSNLAIYQMKFIIAAIYTNFVTIVAEHGDDDIQQMDLYTAPPSSHKLMVRLEYAEA